jgi:hypothetical protein
MITLLESIQKKLKRKHDQLRKTQLKLDSTKIKLVKLKSTVVYQRVVILELRGDKLAKAE